MSNSKKEALVNAEAKDSRGTPSPEGASPATTSGEDDPINILLVDDEPANLTVLGTVLEDPGYRLVCAESGEQALLALVVFHCTLLCHQRPAVFRV